MTPAVANRPALEAAGFREADDRTSGGRSPARNRLIGVVLALVTMICACGEPNGPRRTAGLGFDLAAMSGIARASGLTTDSVMILLRHASDSSLAFSGTYPDGLLGEATGTTIIRTDIPLRVSPEDFLLHIELRQDGTVYYALDTRVTVIAGIGVTTPPLTPSYVGPGKNADSMAFLLVPPAIAPGDSVLAAAVLFEKGLGLTGVPVGYVSSDSGLVQVHPAALGVAWLVASAALAGSVTITALAPNGLTRSAPLTVLALPLPSATGRLQKFP